MDNWKKAKASDVDVSLDKNTYSNYKNDVIEMINTSTYRSYVSKLLSQGSEKCLDNSLLAIDLFLEFRKDHPDLDSLTGDLGKVPFLEYDEYTDSLVVKYAYSKAEKERLRAISNIIVTDSRDKAMIIEHGRKILSDVSNLPKVAKPSPFIADARKVLGRMAPYLEKDSESKGFIFTEGGSNSNYLLDFALFLGAKKGKSVGAISSGMTFAKMTMNFGDDYKLVSSYLDDARRCDVLCIYDLDSLPVSKNFIESVFIPFLSTRKQEGKITFAAIGSDYASFIGGLSSFTATRGKINSLLKAILDEMKESTDHSYF